MEVRIYKNLEFKSNGIWLFRCGVDCPETFSFEKCIDTFRSLYGSGVIIELLVV